MFIFTARESCVNSPVSPPGGGVFPHFASNWNCRFNILNYRLANGQYFPVPFSGRSYGTHKLYDHKQSITLCWPHWRIPGGLRGSAGSSRSVFTKQNRVLVGLFSRYVLSVLYGLQLWGTQRNFRTLNESDASGTKRLHLRDSGKSERDKGFVGHS